MEGHIAATYTLIYRFLKHQSQSKAAEAVKKAAKSIVVLRDDIEPGGPPLEDIIREWKQSKEKAKSDDESSSEESDSSDGEALSHPAARNLTPSESEDSSSADSSSEDTSDSESEDDDTSDDDDSSDASDEESPAKKSPQKPVERDTSATLSSAGEKEVADQLAKIVGISATKDKNEDASSASGSSDSDSSSQSATSDNSDAESSSNSSDSSSSSESSDEEGEKPNKQPPSSKPKGEQPCPSESSSSESSDEEEEKPSKQPPSSKPKGEQPGPSESSSSESSSESEDESDSESERKVDEHIAKKRKVSESGAAMATAHPPSMSQHVAQQRKEKPPPKVKERFQRVKVQNIAPEMLLSNGYEAKGGVSSDYGERAHRDLIVTRGAGFRKEKNKKKRGSYRGGEITMESHSIKFDF